MQELGGTKAYTLQNSADNKSVDFYHCCHTATKFAVSIKEDHKRLPTIYWLPKLHKRPYKARFIANSSSCTTTELSKLLTSCLTAIKTRLSIVMFMKGLVKIFSGLSKTPVKLKSRGFRATSLSTYDYSTLYTTLPHNLIKEKLIDLIEITFQREWSLYLACKKCDSLLLLVLAVRIYTLVHILCEWHILVKFR